MYTTAIACIDPPPASCDACPCHDPGTYQYECRLDRRLWFDGDIHEPLARETRHECCPLVIVPYDKRTACQRLLDFCEKWRAS